MYLRALAALTALAILPALAEAQRRCSKGIPCGNSCISATKTCRIGGSEPTAPPRPAGAVAPRAAVLQQAAGTPTPSDVSRTDSVERLWVGSGRGWIYYRSSCEVARDMDPRLKKYFQTEEEAQQLGYRRSKEPGC